MHTITCLYIFVENVWTAATYIALNTLEILTPCVDSGEIHSIERITLLNALYQQCQHR